MPPLRYRAPETSVKGRMDPLISIIDDDRAVRDALQRMLRSYGYATEVFASAEEFLAAGARDNSSCLILDVRMPGISGLALHRKLVAESCRIPTILITACPTTGEREQAIAAGAFSYLAKPFSEHILMRTIGEALAHSPHTAD